MTRCDRCGYATASYSHEHQAWLCGNCYFGGPPELTGAPRVRRPLGGTISANDTLSTPSSRASSKPAGIRGAEPNETRDEGLGTRDKGNVGSEEREEPQAVEAPQLETAEEPEVEALLRKHRAGRLKPAAVDLPALPEAATAVMRDVAEFYVLVRGLRLAVGDDRAVPFATAWVGRQLDWSKITVWRTLRQLVEAGVLQEPVPLPGRGKRGTHSYLPGAVPPAALFVERRAEVVTQPDQPEMHVVDEPLVAGAEVAVADGPGDAAGDGAHSTGVGHDGDATDDSWTQCAIDYDSS